METMAEQVKISRNYESVAWKWMRYSGLLLIPLAWTHVLIQDVLVGVHRIDLDYVAMRWSMLGWQIFDILLLAFTFAHGMNGLRQVLHDFIRSEKTMRTVSWGLLLFWLVLSAIGATAIIAGARME
jgi:succinate dehydrogenase / fumarate reductase membrane anchor subunit